MRLPILRASGWGSKAHVICFSLTVAENDPSESPKKIEPKVHCFLCRKVPEI